MELVVLRMGGDCGRGSRNAGAVFAWTRVSWVWRSAVETKFGLVSENLGKPRHVCVCTKLMGGVNAERNMGSVMHMCSSACSQIWRIWVIHGRPGYQTYIKFVMRRDKVVVCILRTYARIIQGAYPNTMSTKNSIPL